MEIQGLSGGGGGLIEVGIFGFDSTVARITETSQSFWSHATESGL
jgi:hypothetical protein